MFIIAASGSKANEPPIAGIECESKEQGAYHVHPQLIIYFEGQLVTIPGNLGIVDHECYYWLHTHDTSGTIHVEAPRQETFTLRQFLAIWKQTGSSPPPPIFDQTPDGKHSIRATVNGQPWTGDPADIPLAAQSVIIVEYGPPFKSG